MTRIRTTLIAAIAAMAMGPNLVVAATVWDESVHGDLSTDPGAPTGVALGLGSNLVIGSVQTPNDTRDYLTFTIPVGKALQSLLLNQYEDLDVGGPGDRGFHGIVVGGTSFVPDGNPIGNFLGTDHLDPEPSGTDILPDLGTTNLGAQGFTPPLGPGTYTYHVQQTGPELSGYALDFVIVPEPTSTALGSLAAGSLLARRRRRTGCTKRDGTWLTLGSSSGSSNL